MATAATAALAAPTAAWDWGALAKEEAEAKLASSPEGTFLVRASASTAGAFSISLVKDGVVSHIRIQNVDGGYIIKKKDKVHPTLAALIKAKTNKKIKTVTEAGAEKKSSKLLVAALPNPAFAAKEAVQVEMSGKVEDVGKRCVVAGYDGVEGTIRFVGVSGDDGKKKVGVELDQPSGKHSGTSKGFVYFKCAKKCGVLVAPSKITTLVPDSIADEDGVENYLQVGSTGGADDCEVDQYLQVDSRGGAGGDRVEDGTTVAAEVLRAPAPAPATPNVEPVPVAAPTTAAEAARENPAAALPEVPPAPPASALAPLVSEVTAVPVPSPGVAVVSTPAQEVVAVPAPAQEAMAVPAQTPPGATATPAVAVVVAVAPEMPAAPVPVVISIPVPVQTDATPAPAPAVPAVPAVPPCAPGTPAETLWAGAGKNADGLLPAGVVASILSSSGLTQKILRTVWSDAKKNAIQKSGGATMNQVEFAEAVSLAVAAGGVFGDSAA